MSSTLYVVLWGIVLIAIYTFIAYLQGEKPFIGAYILIGVLTFIASIIPKPILPPTENLTTSESLESETTIPNNPSEKASATEEWVTIYRDIKAPATDFLFPESRDEYLSQERINEVLASNDQETRIRRSQLAINEMLARYGYEFNKQNSKTADDAREKFSGKDWYQRIKGEYPSDAKELYALYFTEIERVNYDALNEWQRINDADYYIDDNGAFYRD